jgi:hypothetical protein
VRGISGLPVSSVVVNDPKSATVGQALDDLLRPGGTPSTKVEFKVEEASSFAEAMVSAGISAEYQGVFKGELGGSISDANSHRTVVAFLKQPMFTVYFNRGTVASAELLAPAVKLDDLNALKQRGEVGTDNVPVYVASVKYGKMLTFIMTADSSHSAADLKAALNASYEGVEGGGHLTAEQKQILSRATYKFVIIGGTQESAKQAIASADWHKFFAPEPGSSAVPIEFEVKTVASDDVAQLVEVVTYDELGDCDKPTGYEMKVEWVSVQPTAGACNLLWGFYVRAGTGIWENAAPVHTQRGQLTEKWAINRSVTFNVPESMDTKLGIGAQIWDVSGVGVLMGANQLSLSYPFSGVPRAEAHPVHIDVNFQTCPARFNLNLTKTPMY